jgi:hypothetical protein
MTWLLTRLKLQKKTKGVDLTADQKTFVADFRKLDDGNTKKRNDFREQETNAEVSSQQAALDDQSNWFERAMSDPVTLALIAASIAFPGAGTSLGKTLGLSGQAATIGGGAALGAGISVATGGDPLKGAIFWRYWCSRLNNLRNNRW